MTRPFTTPLDTSPEAQAWQENKWRSMEPWQKAELANQLTLDCTALALAGTHARSDGLSQNEIRYQLALRRYGQELADEVYGTPTEADSSIPS